MISNQVLQSTIDSLKSITRVDIAIADIDGKVLASTFTDNQYTESMVSSFAESQADSQAVGGYQFFKIFDEHQLEYVLIAMGDSDDVYMVGKLAAFQIHIRRSSIRTTSSRTSCSTTCFWSTSITVRRSCISMSA